MNLPGHEFAQFQGHLISFLEEFLKHVVSTDRSQSRKGEFLHRPLDVGNGIESFPGNSDVIVDSSIDSDFDVIPGEGIKSIEVDDVGFHVNNMNSVGTGVEVLQT